MGLPGVGRKTANVVLGNAFGRPHGIAVDTHVQRLARRLGLTTETTPDKIERDLVALVRRKDWTLFRICSSPTGEMSVKRVFPTVQLVPCITSVPRPATRAPGSDGTLRRCRHTLLPMVIAHG